MLRYEYKCKDHGIKVEISGTNAEIPICPSCNAEMLRIYSISGIVFKGSGFYKTDTR